MSGGAEGTPVSRGGQDGGGRATGVLGPSFATVFARELGRLARELDAYRDEADLWRVEGTVKNSPGTLALHCVGNLEAYVGAALGGTGYVRDREAEFGDRNVSRAEILDRLEACARMIRTTLEALPDEALLRPHPEPVPEPMRGMTTAQFLIHLTWHLGWHVGQVDYHRRLLVGGDAV